MGKRITTPSDRNLAIWERRRSGATLRVIGDEFCLTKERIRQIVWKTNLLLRVNEAIEKYAAGMSIEEIACFVNEKYGFASNAISAEGLRRLIENRLKCTPSVYRPQRCETCAYGLTLRRGHVYECHHPDRVEPYLFYGKTHPHNCPALRRDKGSNQRAG